MHSAHDSDGARPDYELYDVYKHARFYVCRGCGSLVTNMHTHDDWHHRLIQPSA